MKRIVLTFLVVLSAVLNANAQYATENSNGLDNLGIGVTGGISTPLDFNSVFPLNTNVGLKVIKGVSPLFGFEAEGLAVLNDNHFSDVKTSVKATNVSLSGLINLSNAFVGYKGTPRNFELGLVTGLGWLHTWNSSANFLSAKTGLDFMFNLGKKKAHSIVITPAVYWNLNKFTNIHFNKNASQLAVNLSYIYHFKNSNGTHSYKVWNVGAMNDEINYYRGRLEECESREPQIVEKIIEKEIVKNVESNPWIIQFAQASSELTDEAKATLDTINRDLIVDVVGTASPEGDKEFNQRLSEDRAAVVADYLTKRGLRVNSYAGKGVQIGEATNRLAIVTITK